MNHNLLTKTVHSFVSAIESQDSLVGIEKKREKDLKSLATHLLHRSAVCINEECLSAVNALERSFFANSKYYCDLLKQS